MAPAVRSKRPIIANTASPTSGVTARRASRCSAPISSEVSARIDVPPAATSRSLEMPRAGFAVMPESASEPPHSSARQIASSGAGCGTVRAAAATSRSTSGSTARTVPALPPQPASVKSSMRSARRAAAEASAVAESSSPIRTVAATFACVAKPSSTRSTRSTSIAAPCPVQSWLTATAPGFRLATCSATAHAAAWMGRMRTWLRKPHRPSPR